MTDLEDMIVYVEGILHDHEDLPIARIRTDRLTDILATLREQKLVEPRWFTDVHHPAGAFVCSACRERIVEKNFDFYCPKCGRKVKWDGDS